MKDIDFDELDKAVSSLMGSVPAGGDPDDRPKVQSLTVPTTLSGDGQPFSYSAIEQAAARIGGETIVKRQEPTEIVSKTPAATTTFTVAEASADEPPLEEQPTAEAEPTTATTVVQPQRRGQFMDVFHASSDMKQRANRAAEPIDPVGSRGDQMVKQDEILPGAKKVSHEAPVLAPMNEDDAATVAEVAAETSMEPSVVDEPIPEPVVLATANDEDSTPPLATPFLPDAKVKKRPLGTASSSTAFPDATSAPVRPEPQLAAPVPEEHVPDELKDELMAIELAGTPEADLLPDEPSHQLDTPALEAVAQEPLEPSEPVVDQSNLSETVPEVVTTDEVSASEPIATTATDTPQVPLSDTSTGAIYDTTEYHAPVAHPAKQSNWLWVVLIIVVIAIGAGGGALLYYVTTMQ